MTGQRRGVVALGESPWPGGRRCRGRRVRACEHDARSGATQTGDGSRRRRSTPRPSSRSRVDALAQALGATRQASTRAGTALGERHLLPRRPPSVADQPSRLVGDRCRSRGSSVLVAGPPRGRPPRESRPTCCQAADLSATRPSHGQAARRDCESSTRCRASASAPVAGGSRRDRRRSAMAARLSRVQPRLRSAAARSRRLTSSTVAGSGRTRAMAATCRRRAEAERSPSLRSSTGGRRRTGEAQRLETAAAASRPTSTCRRGRAGSRPIARHEDIGDTLVGRTHGRCSPSRRAPSRAALRVATPSMGRASSGGVTAGRGSGGPDDDRLVPGRPESDYRARATRRRRGAATPRAARRRRGRRGRASGRAGGTAARAGRRPRRRR